MEEEYRNLTPLIKLQTKCDSWNILQGRLSLPQEVNGIYSKKSLQLLLEKSDRIQQIPLNVLLKKRKSVDLVVSLQADYLIALLEAMLEAEGRASMCWEPGSNPPLDYICQCIDYLDTNHKIDIWKTPVEDFQILRNIGQEYVLYFLLLYLIFRY